jgi:hypothetical protein
MRYLHQIRVKSEFNAGEFYQKKLQCQVSLQ